MASDPPVNRVALIAAAVFFVSLSLARADSSVEQVQHALKDQGFYYGEITGQMDADTTAAIRRFQIRNGLKVTGQLDGETQKSLGVSGAAATVKPSAAATAAPRATTPPDISGGRDESAPPTEPQIQPSPRVEVPPDYNQPPPDTQPPLEAQPGITDVFVGTPFATAPPEVQQRVVIGAQTVLMRAGYYRSGIDGDFGPGTAAALRAYQVRVGLEPTGRLDMRTLSALGLLPAQNRPGFWPRHRFMRPPGIEIAPNGEPIYRPH